MGFDHLKGRFWRQVTREERFFCQHLFELITVETPRRFVQNLCEDYGLSISTEGEWEVGYEVCFYRDLWQLREKQGELYSPKRTFDLCLFGEEAIIIIEAKAAVGFDYSQNESFGRDRKAVARLAPMKEENIKLVGLCSSKYSVEPELAKTFDGGILTWKELAKRYSDDEILNRADSIYDAREAFSSAGARSDVRLSGSVLLEAFHGGAKWWVGRGGGGLGSVKFLAHIFEASCSRWYGNLLNTMQSCPSGAPHRPLHKGRWGGRPR